MANDTDQRARETLLPFRSLNGPPAAGRLELCGEGKTSPFPQRASLPTSPVEHEKISAALNYSRPSVPKMGEPRGRRHPDRAPGWGDAVSRPDALSASGASLQFLPPTKRSVSHANCRDRSSPEKQGASPPMHRLRALCPPHTALRTCDFRFVLGNPREEKTEQPLKSTSTCCDSRARYSPD